MVLVGGQQHVLRDVDLDAMAFADRDRGLNIDELVEHRRTGRGKAGGQALPVHVRAAFANNRCWSWPPPRRR